MLLRWERIVGKLCARMAQRKLQLLLHWLQMQLAFTEGCSARLNWLSDKVRAMQHDGCRQQHGGVAGSRCMLSLRRYS
jgi:hypothetical protein